MHDVVIVGAGPVGLFLACELGLAGTSVLVLEREPEPGSPWRSDQFGMRGLFGASLEAFQRRGLLHPLLAASGVDEEPDVDLDADLDVAGPTPLRGGVGHFAGMVLDPAKVDLAALPFRLPSPAPDAVMTNLTAIETVLSERAAKLGVEIRRGVTVTGITQSGHADKDGDTDEEGVIVRAGEHAYTARWAVGCDGGRSTVRRLAGFEFVGSEPQFTGYVMLSTLADPEKLSPGINLTPNGMYLQMLSEGHIGVLDFDGGAFDRSRRPTREHLQAVLRRVSGTDVTLSEVHLASSFTDRAMQTTTYRQGRVLLAGDAAHIHSPLGGQGLNTGLGDALNLGWKLAATVRGHAPDGLLDTYTRERHPVGARVLDWTRAQTAAMQPTPQGQAVQGLLRDLVETQDVTTYMFERISGSSVRYDLGDEHPLVGRSAPDFRLEDGTCLGDLMQDGRGVVLDFSADARLREAGLVRQSRLRYASGTARNDLGLGAVLVRPDGFVVWAGRGDLDREAFERAADQWFGPKES
ncbi:FAD-dependent oxidoreductase [Streptomyces luteocolor]|uniref:FAD-dependent oxidoreductase n=1 Tax=Streptomyces luteocolor TaxID=285500 RepID=UPI00085296B5|nr:FAD-dependent oxidoreductase [Streptomyces luteocolor]